MTELVSPCVTCRYSSIPYVCEPSYCDKVQEFEKMRQINPEYIKLAQTAHDTALRIMIDGEKTHPGNGWKEIDAKTHLRHALEHVAKAYCGYESGEDDIANALTRLAMVMYLRA